MAERPAASENDFLSSVLDKVMADPDYLVGAEPEGSNWDFRGWEGMDFTEFGGWVRREKFFEIHTLDRRVLTMRIIQTDPGQFPLRTKDGRVGVSYVIAPVMTRVVPTVFIGKDGVGKDQVLRNARESVELHNVPTPLQDLARTFGPLDRNRVTSDNKGSEWANFLARILEERKVFPDDLRPTEEIARDVLELEKKDIVTEREIRFAEMRLTEQELLGLAYADYAIV